MKNLKNKTIFKILLALTVLIIFALVLTVNTVSASILLTPDGPGTNKIEPRQSQNRERLYETDVDDLLKEFEATNKMTDEKMEEYDKLDTKFAIDNEGRVFINKVLRHELLGFAKNLEKTFNNPAFQAFMVFFGFFLLATIFIIMILKLIRLIAKWIMYNKAGKPGWAMLLPVYRDAILLEIAGLSPALLLFYLLVFIPFIGPFLYAIAAFVIKIIVSVNISKAFGKSGGFAVGLIFLPTIFYGILGFGKSKYNEDNISGNNPKETTEVKEKMAEAVVIEDTKETKKETKTTEKKEVKEKDKEKPKTETKNE